MADAAQQFARLAAALAERYRVERKLGEGGMATVWLAQDVKHDRPVALKVLRPEIAAALGPERFLREVRITARLSHPHILPLLDSGEADGLVYYTMPYVEGESLRDRLEREKQLPLDDAVQIAREVADALSYAHSHGVVHRDIKPENILLESGHALVADFGIARAITTAGAERLTDTGIAVGTPAYMSPEQGAGRADVDGRSDLYSLGCVLYEMLAGHPPFQGTSAQEVLARHLVDAVPRLSAARSGVPAPIEDAVLKVLEKTPADRFPTAEHFVAALAPGAALPGALEQVVAAQLAAALDVEAHRPRQRMLRVLQRGAVGVAVALMIVAGWWVVSRSSGESPVIRSLVVLPLDNLTGDREQQFFVDGMHDALTAELSRISGLRVTSRTSAMQYKDVPKPAPQIARELGIDGLVEGSVSRDGGRVRITVQLIHARSDRRVWSDSYERDVRGILELQGEVARAIAAQIQVNLTSNEESRLASRRLIDPSAYEHYLRGLYQWNKLSPEGWKASIEELEESIRRDSTFAPPYALLSLAHTLLSYYGEFELQQRASLAAERAVTLDNTLAEAHASLAMVRFAFDWDWPAADRASAEAVRLDPASPMALYARAFFLSFMGRLDDAVSLARHAVQLDPVAPHTNTQLAMFYFMARRYDDAIAQADKVLALEPDYEDAVMWASYAYAKQRAIDEATRLRLALERIVGQQWRWWWMEAWLAALAGRPAEARTLLDEHPPGSGFFWAIVYGEAGDYDRAFAHLERAYAGRSPFMPLIKVDPRIDALRNDRRFEAMLRRMALPP